MERNSTVDGWRGGWLYPIGETLIVDGRTFQVTARESVLGGRDVLGTLQLLDIRSGGLWTCVVTQGGMGPVIRDGELNELERLGLV